MATDECVLIIDNRSDNGCQGHPLHGCFPDECFSDNNRSQAGHNHADTHSNIRKSLILGNQGSGQGHKGVGNSQAQDGHVVGIHTQGANHLLIVSGCPHGETDLGVKEHIR